jgi:chromosome segregation ATPase
VREARERAEQAQRALAEAEDLLHAAEWNADELRDERHELETRLKELRSEIADAERDEREAERVRAKAAIAVDRARDDVEAAEAALERLD